MNTSAVGDRRSRVVSVIITTYNRADLVGRAIESVQRQSHADLEIIIVDDGSTDGTREVLRGYAERDPRIRIVALAENLGVNAAKNRGLDSATGTFTTMLDSDDEFEPGAIATFLDMFERLDPEYGMVVCNCVDPASGEWTGLGVDGDTDLSYEDAICRRFHGDFSAMWRTDLVAGLRFPEGRGAYESLVWDQAYRRCRVRYHHVVTLRYHRETPGSVMSVRFDKESNRRAAEAEASYLGVLGTDIALVCPEHLAQSYRVMALHLTLAGQRRRAGHAALRAMRCHLTAATLMGGLLPICPRGLLVSLLHRRAAIRGQKVA